MLDPRWRKIAGDLREERGRIAMMVAAIAVSLVAIGTVLGAYAILTREIAVNYLGTNPASATLEVHGLDQALLDAVREHPNVQEAEARGVVLARARVGDAWRPLLLFVVDDFADLRINTFASREGAWPPPEGTMLIERSARGMLEATVGGSVVVQTPRGEARPLAITGLVHDPGLAPAWQERQGYGYVTTATLAGLGEPDSLDELRIVTRGDPADIEAIEASAAEVAAWLGTRGHPVHEIRVPPPQRHPHQRQMTTILVMMLSFGSMALVLSAILVATSLAAMLARQVREIGVMKTIGARTGQIAVLYAGLVAVVGVVAVAVALPVAVLGARGFAREISGMLNFDLTSVALPWWVFASVAVSGVAIPLLVAAVPILRASRVTVREALDQHGVSNDRIRPGFSNLPTPLRDALRRPARLALTLGLLAAGGGMFMTALDVSAGWERNIEKVYETRHYDLEVRLHEPVTAPTAARLGHIPGVRAVETWGYGDAAVSRTGRIDIVRTWPDQSHGSLVVMGVPPATGLVGFPVLEGRWLQAGDTDSVVLNHSVRAQAPDAAVGQEITLSIDGLPTRWTVVGIVEEIGSPGAAYVTDAAFAEATGGSGRMLRIALDDPSRRIEVLAAVEDALAAEGARVETAIPLFELRNAVGDHIGILIRALVAMAFVMATVGMLGLGSTMSVSVVERTREIGVMKAVGATPARIVRRIAAEAVTVGGLSWVFAVLLSLPLTYGVDALVGNIGFLAPLPFVVAPGPVALWGALVFVMSLAATSWPAANAARLTVREALAHP